MDSVESNAQVCRLYAGAHRKDVQFKSPKSHVPAIPAPRPTASPVTRHISQLHPNLRQRRSELYKGQTRLSLPPHALLGTSTCASQGPLLTINSKSNALSSPNQPGVNVWTFVLC